MQCELYGVAASELMVMDRVGQLDALFMDAKATEHPSNISSSPAWNIE